MVENAETGPRFRKQEKWFESGFCWRFAAVLKGPLLAGLSPLRKKVLQNPHWLAGDGARHRAGLVIPNPC